MTLLYFVYVYTHPMIACMRTVYYYFATLLAMLFLNIFLRKYSLSNINYDLLIFKEQGNDRDLYVFFIR